MQVVSDLGIEDTDTKVDDIRRGRLLKSLNIFYSHNLDLIRKMKICIRAGANITPMNDYLTTEVRYAVREDDGATLFTLPHAATVGLAPWLDEPQSRLYTPFTINELIASRNLETAAEVALVNSVAYNLIHTGVMEFV
jgi:hypothetical protein